MYKLDIYKSIDDQILAAQNTPTFPFLEIIFYNY